PDRACWSRARRSTRSFSGSAVERGAPAVRNLPGVSSQYPKAPNRTRRTRCPDRCRNKPSARSSGPVWDGHGATCVLRGRERGGRKFFEKSTGSCRNGAVVEDFLAKCDIQQPQLKWIVQRSVFPFFDALPVPVRIQYGCEWFLNPIRFRKCTCHLSHL